MLIQSTGNTVAAAAPRPPGDSAPVAVATPQSNSAPVAVATPQSNNAPVAQQQAGVKPSPEQQVAPNPTPAQLQSAVDNINKALKQSNSNLEFSIDTDTHKTVFKVVEAATGNVIRQYPTEEALAISRAIDQLQQQGLLIKQQA